MSHYPILLASSSPYRAQLLSKLGLSFEQASPDLDETPHKNESLDAMVKRLSAAKAKALESNYPNHIIIGSDQALVSPDGQILGKPMSIDNAIAQLQLLSNKRVTFLTGLTLICPQKYNTAHYIQTVVEEFTVYFKSLSKSEIEAYVNAEKPLNCAGSFKSEGLGISLFKKLEGDDPNTLIGLPLIRLCELLNNIGLNVLSHQK